MYVSLVICDFMLMGSSSWLLFFLLNLSILATPRPTAAALISSTGVAPPLEVPVINRNPMEVVIPKLLYRSGLVYMDSPLHSGNLDAACRSVTLRRFDIFSPEHIRSEILGGSFSFARSVQMLQYQVHMRYSPCALIFWVLVECIFFLSLLRALECA